MIHREGGKKWVLPEVVRGQKGGLRHYFYTVRGFMQPKKGDYYLSGAKIMAYRAFADLDDEYLVIDFTDKAYPKGMTRWERRTDD